MPIRPPTEYALRLAESRDAAPLVTRCLVDGCDWKHVGVAGDGREAARAHREARHPELPLVGRRPSGRVVRPTFRLPERRQGPGRPSLMTDERTAAAAAVYARGYSIGAIAEVAADVWGYASPASAKTGVQSALARAGVPIRPRGRRIDRTITDAEATRMLRAAAAIPDKR